MRLGSFIMVSALTLPLAAALSGCSSPSGSGDGGTGGSGGSGGSGSGCGTAPMPITGTWKILKVECDGNPAPPAIAAIYSGSNVAEYEFTTATSGTQVSGTVMTGGGTCDLSVPLTFKYPAADTIQIFGNGPSTCSPANCGGGACGMTGTANPIYTYVESGPSCSQLTFTSTDSEVCGGISPVVYILEPG
jgi:hypothetical protein